MKPLARKYQDGWKAAVTMADGRVRVLSRTLHPTKERALLHAQLLLSAQEPPPPSDQWTVRKHPQSS